VQFLEKAVQAAPDAALMHYHLGMAHLASGNAVAARDYLARATESTIDFKGKEEAAKALTELSAQSTQ
jgi:uncharacterized protein HemY